MLGIQVPAIDLAEIDEEPRQPLVPPADMRAKTREELLVRPVPRMVHARF
jgi:hypothetical protein